MLSNVGVQWCDGYEIHYASEANSRSPVEGPIVVYLPIQQEAFESTFLPTPGLAERDSAEFDPAARLIKERTSNDRFVITPAGIRTSNPHITGLTGVVERLLASEGFKHVLHPAELPAVRWENIRVTSIPLSSGLEDYCEALRCEYRNGFVEARCYRIDEGEVEDSVLATKRYPENPLQFMEMLRHPVIARGFQVESADWECLIVRANWIDHSPFLFSGFLAETLAYGGAYSRWSASEEVRSKALRLANEVFLEFGGFDQGVSLAVCRKPWCSRFCDIAWDHTWIIFQPTIRTFTILLATDTD
jgi:hypothetical protein